MERGINNLEACTAYFYPNPCLPHSSAISRYFGSPTTISEQDEEQPCVHRCELADAVQPHSSAARAAELWGYPANEQGREMKDEWGQNTLRSAERARARMVQRASMVAHRVALRGR